MRPSVAITTSLLALVAMACIPATSLRSTMGPDETATVVETAAVPTASPAASGPPSFVRPTPTPQPSFLAYVVKAGDTLTSIAKAHRTTARSIAFWNRTQHPSLDPDSPTYRPDRIEVGWVLLLVPDLELDPEDLPPEPTASPATPGPTPSPTVSAARGRPGTG